MQQYDMHELLQIKWSNKITRMIFIFFEGYANKGNKFKMAIFMGFSIMETKQKGKETLFFWDFRFFNESNTTFSFLFRGF